MVYPDLQFITTKGYEKMKNLFISFHVETNYSVTVVQMSGLRLFIV